jgi:CRISPR-associated endonuclease Csn1
MNKKAVVKEEKVNAKFDLTKINQVTKAKYREALLVRLLENANDPKRAFSGKNTLGKNPIFLDSGNTEIVPEKVKIKYFEDNYSIRKPISPDLKIEKVLDQGVREILKARLDEYNGKPKEAFSNLDENPIWLNKEKGIVIKRVKISGVSHPEALHTKKDHFGEEILADSRPQAVDFVSTGNNHHVAIYEDEEGKLQEQVVSFYEAVARVNGGLPIIDYEYQGWKLLFTMKQNEMFVFQNGDFNPKEIDLLDGKNANAISSNLYRVQKIGSKDYTFRHHLETSVTNNIKGFTFSRILSTEPLRNCIKVRLNHLGQIVHVGEY